MTTPTELAQKARAIIVNHGDMSDRQWIAGSISCLIGAVEELDAKLAPRRSLLVAAGEVIAAFDAWYACTESHAERLALERLIDAVDDLRERK